MPRMQELIDPYYYTRESQGHDIDLLGLYNSIVQHAVECVRDVLRTEGSTLTYEAAKEVQNRIKEFFEV